MSYAVKDPVRVEFTGKVLSSGTEALSTSKVREDGTGYIHYIYLGTEDSRRQVLAGNTGATPAVGDEIAVSFTGTVDSERPFSGTDLCTRVKGPRLRGGSGYTHLIYLESTSVRPVGVYASGDRVRVAFTGQVVGDGGEASATTRVREDNGTEHFLYLGSPRGRADILADGADVKPRTGDTVRVAFTGTVDTRRTVGSRTQVDTATGFVEYIDLSSASVSTVSTVRQAYARGDKIRAEFEAEVLKSGQVNATTRVRETGNGYVHYLYLGSGSAPVLVQDYSGAPLREGDKITVSFEATVDANAPLADVEGCTEVRTNFNSATTGLPLRYVHYLNLNSPSIRPTPAPASAPAEETPMRISAASTEITDEDLEAAIDELAESELTWAATRSRNGEVLRSGFADETEAESWIADNDYNPERVSPTQVEGEPSEYLLELRRLQQLADDYIEGWGSGAKVLRTDQLTDDYAKDVFREDDRYLDLDSWPYNCIDWAAAAAKLKEYRNSFSWDGETWYSAQD